MLPLNQAFNILDQIILARSLRLPSEEIQVINGLNRVLAATQFSRLTLPPFDKSAMDGYAIIASDYAEQKIEYTLLETIAAGEVARQKLQPGTTIKIMTGAPVPQGASVIVPIENTEIKNNKIIILNWPRGSNICPFGEDIKSGDEILSKGKFLDPVAIANLIACGITTVPVHSKLQAVIISTGEEIVNDFANITPGKIMDSNGPMLQTLCYKHGIDVVANLKVGDDYAATVAVLKQYLTTTDIILLSGGVSAGDFDFVTKALSDAGLTMHFNRVAIKPGKPTTFASNDKTALVFALPGNPVAVYLTFHLFVLRTMKLLFGVKPVDQESYITLPLAQDFKHKETERVVYVPCRLDLNGTLLPLKSHGSAHLAILLQSSGFFVVPKDISELKQGEKATFFNIS
ncbi:MAG TPA: hypothetical protein DCZ38_04490 [Coxiellaceae bacterium]|nr:hypothetical protein [Coxiellaceae bacterium]